MKRSGSLRLTLMASALPLALTACDNPAITGEQNYQDQSWAMEPSAVAAAPAIDCSTTELMQTDACKAELERIMDESPRYSSREECAGATGNDCQQVRYNGESRWISPLTGFLAGMVLSDLLDDIGDRHRRGYRYSSSPYRDRYRSNPTPSSYPSSRPSSYPSAAPSAPPPSRAITTSRSGFGSSSAARSSFGGFGG